MQTCLVRFLLALPLFGLLCSNINAQGSPREQFNAIRAEFDKALAVYLKRLQGAASVAEQGKIFREENPQPAFAGRFLELARKHPKDPVAYGGLSWIVQTSEFGPAAAKPYADAIALLATHHADHKDNEMLLERMASSPFVSSGQFLQAVFEKHPSPAVRGRAGFQWALFLKNYCATVEKLNDQPDWAKNVESFVGPEMVKQLKSTDTVKMLRQTEDLFARIEKDHGLIVYKKTNLARAAAAELFEMRHLSVGKVAPDIEGDDTDGKPLKLSDYRGKVVLLVFWGTWCPHCVGMFPQERALVKKFEGEPFAVVGVNSDEAGDKLKNFLTKQRVTWRSFLDGGNSEGPIATRWNVQGWPAVYVIDAKGVICFKHVRDEQLDRAVETLMKEAKGQR